MKKTSHTTAYTALFLALVLLCGCAAAGGGRGDSVSVYRVLTQEWQTDGELLRAEEVEISGSDAVGTVIAALGAAPQQQELGRSLPEGVEILSFHQAGSEVSVELSEEYLALAGMEKTVTDYCVALSLCSVDGVESVTLFVDGAAVTPGLTADGAVLLDEETNPYEKRLRLFFADAGGRYLTAEYHSLTLGEDTPAERVVMEELLRGPYGDTLKSAVPEGTRLLSVSTADGLCSVDLSGEFLRNGPDSVTGWRLAVYSVVNSLTALADVDRVSLSVEGETALELGGLLLSEPLERRNGMAGPANAAHGERDIDVYMEVGDSGMLAAIPCVVPASAEASAEELALTALLETPVEFGCTDLFPEGSIPFSAVTAGGVCTVDLPESFFDSRTRRELELSAAAITATLTGIDGVAYVKLLKDGRPPDPANTGLSQLMTKNGDIIID